MKSIRLFVLPLLLALAASPVLARQSPPVLPPATHVTVTTDDGLPLALWSRSAAQPTHSVLLVHGRTWSARPNFDLQTPGGDRSVLKAFADRGYAAYAVDLRGYGDSPRDASGWITPDRACADVVQVLQWIQRQHPGLPAPALVGYSQGAAVALLTAQRAPQAMSSLVLYGFAADVDAAPRDQATPAQPPRVKTTAEAAGEDFLVQGAFSPQVKQAYVTQALASDPVRNDWRAASQFAFRPETVHVPTLLIRGAQDPYNTQDKYARLFLRLGSEDKRWINLPGSDHVAHVENSHAAWVAAITEFIARP
jgi:pimeloyl-ACP methyl ester carboxylesterase